jgi:hypothetical protein
MITKITGAIGSLFRRKEPPQFSIKYADAPRWTVKHSSLEAQQPQADDGWLSANGRYNLRNWIDRR